MALVLIVVLLLYVGFRLIYLGTMWERRQKKRRAAALGRAHGDAGQSGDDEAIFHGDLGAILRRQMQAAAETDPAER